MEPGLKRSFMRYMEEAIGQDNAAVAFSALEMPPSVSVRVNPEKPGRLPEGVCGRVPWSGDGFFLSSRPAFTLDPMFHAGAYYVQDSSSMFVGHVARSLLRKTSRPEGRPVRVLDLCAAPGGKTTDLAASLRRLYGNDFVLVSNEVMGQRASVLASNVAVWGDPCVIVTSEDPSRLASMKGWFDVVLADVPCSGEGMFRKDMKAREQWSEDTVALCQGRQRRIVADVWPALAEGGVFIYSTCTFNRYENDGNAEWIADVLGAESVPPDDPCWQEDGEGKCEGVIRTGYGFSLVPGFVRGEGQYCAALIKTSTEKAACTGKPRKPSCQVMKGEEAGKISGCFRGRTVPVSRDGFVKVIPEEIFQDVRYVEDRLHVLSSGCAAGELKKGMLVPDADMALSVLFRKEAYPSCGLSLEDALSYLRGNQLVLRDIPTGYAAVEYSGLPLGFVKNLGSRCNNLYPKGRRIRMDINRMSEKI